MPSPYVTGRTGSFCVPTTACVDAELGKLTERLKTGRGQRSAILADLDALLERRLALADRKVPS